MQPGVGGYAATKAALNMLTAVARKELEPDGIAVSLVVPSITATEFGGGMFAELGVGGALLMTSEALPIDTDLLKDSPGDNKNAPAPNAPLPGNTPVPAAPLPKNGRGELLNIGVAWGTSIRHSQWKTSITIRRNGLYGHP